MPKLKHRFIYDDDGEPMKEGAKVLVNGAHEGIIHFDAEGEIAIADFPMEEVETIEQMPDDRFSELEDSILSNE